MKVVRRGRTWTATGYGFRFESRTLEGLFRMVRAGLEPTAREEYGLDYSNYVDEEIEIMRQEARA